jgi:pimeloyl-ACP methyl ester carboxylesterase
VRLESTGTFSHSHEPAASRLALRLESTAATCDALHICNPRQPVLSRLQSRSAYRVFEIVQDIRELAEALGHPRFVLVAHDWGAVAAWQFAAYHQVPVL